MQGEETDVLFRSIDCVFDCNVDGVFVELGVLRGVDCTNTRYWAALKKDATLI